MAKPVKVLLASITGLILLLIIAATLLITFVNPNDFKDKISDYVQQKTDRQLTINGKIAWSFFPWIGVSLSNITLSNAPGFGNHYFAEIKEADVRVRLLPLITGNVEMGKIVLKGLTLNLTKNRSGVTNWQDLTSDKTPTLPQMNPAKKDNAKESAKSAMVILISGIDISNANIYWNNQQSNEKIAIKKLDLKSQHISQNRFFPISLSLQLQKDNLKPINISLNSSVLLNMNNQVLNVKNLKLKIASLQLQGDFSGKQILDTPTFEGVFSIPTFNPKQWLSTLGYPIKTADNSALTKFSGDIAIQGSPGFLKIQKLQANLDNSSIKAEMNIADLDKKSMRFNLSLNQINLDRYAPQSSSSTQAQLSPLATATAASKPTLLAWLRPWNINGNINIGKLETSGVILNNVNMLISVKNGVIQFPITASLYQGSLQSQNVVNINGNLPQWSLNTSLTNAIINTNRLAGIATIKTNINASGTEANLITRTLNGNGSFKLVKGELRGIDVDYELHRASVVLESLRGGIKSLADIGRLISGIQAPKLVHQGPKTTSLGETTGTFTINNGVFYNHNLLVNANHFKIEGNGNINLVSKQLNYLVNAYTTQSFTDQDGQTVNIPSAISLPIRVTGTLSNPHYMPDFAALGQHYLKTQTINPVGSQNLEDVGKNLLNKGLKQLFGK